MSEKARRGGGGGRSVRADENARLKAEVADLRSILGITTAVGLMESVELFEAVGTQEVRDRMVARAFIAEWGRPAIALARLGFDAAKMSTEQKVEIARRLFNAPGVQAILQRDLADLEARKSEILARTVQTALHGDDDAQVRAAALLAKTEGWQKTPDTVIDNRSVNVYTIGKDDTAPARGALREADSQKAPSADLVAFLGHDPGEAIAIDLGDARAEEARAALPTTIETRP